MKQKYKWVLIGKGKKRHAIEDAWGLNPELPIVCVCGVGGYYRETKSKKHEQCKVCAKITNLWERIDRGEGN